MGPPGCYHPPRTTTPARKGEDRSGFERRGLLRVSCSKCGLHQFVLRGEPSYTCVYCQHTYTGYDRVSVGFKRRLPWWAKWGITIGIGFAIGELLKLVGVIQ